MAKVGVQVVGDSAGGQAAFRATSAAAVAFGEDVAAVSAKTQAAWTTQIARLRELAAAYDQAAATAVAGSDEQIAAANLAANANARLSAMVNAEAAAEEKRATVAVAAGRRQVASLETVGRGLSRYVTAPVLLAGAASVKFALNFEDSMLLVHTQAGASTAEVNRMSGDILNLVTSGQSFAQTANSMAKGLFYIESEGIRGAAALDVLKSASAGALVGQTSLAETTNALTSAMKVYGTTAGSSSQVMATLNAVVGAGKMHMEDLTAALGTKLLPVSKQLGVSLPQIGAAIDIFTKTGVPAQAAATNLTTALLKFLAPTKASEKQLAKLGLTSTQLAWDMENGGLPHALETLSKAYDTLVSSQGKIVANQTIIGAFGGLKGGAAALTLVQQYAGYMQTLDQVQKQSSPATFWSDVSAAMHEPHARIHEALAQLSGDMIKIGMDIAPVVADVAHGLTIMTGVFTKLPGPVKEALGAIVIALAAGGPLLLAVAGAKKMIAAIGDAFVTMPLKAGTAIVATDAEIETLGATAGTAATKVGLLGSGLAGIAGKTFVTALIVDMIPRSTKGQSELDKHGMGDLGHLPVVGPFFSQVGNISRPFDHTSDPIASDVAGANSSPYPKGTFLDDLFQAGFTGTTPNTSGHSIASLPAAQRAAYAAGRSQEVSGLTGGGLHGETAPNKNVLAAVQSIEQYALKVKAEIDAMVAKSPKSSPLTARQANEHALAADPNNIDLLKRKAALDASAINWLNKRHDEGKLSNADWVKQTGSMYADQQAAITQIATIQQAAATKAKTASDAAKSAAVKHAAALKTASAAELTALDAGYAVNQQLLTNALELAQLAPADIAKQVTIMKSIASLWGAEAGDKRLPAMTRLQARSSQIGELGQIKSLQASAGAFALPHNLQVAAARASSTSVSADDLRAATEIKAFAEKAIRAGKLSWQGLIDAYNTISQQNQVLGGTAAISNAHVVSAAKLASMLHLTGANKKAGEEILAQVLAHGGHVPRGIGVQGIGIGGGNPLIIHNHLYIDGQPIADVVTTHQQKQNRHSAVQAVGPHAGRQFAS